MRCTQARAQAVRPKMPPRLISTSCLLFLDMFTYFSLILFYWNWSLKLTRHELAAGYGTNKNLSHCCISNNNLCQHWWMYMYAVHCMFICTYNNWAPIIIFLVYCIINFRVIETLLIADAKYNSVWYTHYDSVLQTFFHTFIIISLLSWQHHGCPICGS